MPREELYLERIIGILECMCESLPGIISDVAENKIEDELLEQYYYDFIWATDWFDRECGEGHSGPSAALLYERGVDAVLVLQSIAGIEETFGSPT